MWAGQRETRDFGNDYPLTSVRVEECEGNKTDRDRSYLALNSTGLIVTLGGGGHATTNADSTIPSLNATSLGQVLLTLLLPDLNLLFFTAAAELIRAELVPGLELRPTVFGDITFRHGDRSDGEEKRASDIKSIEIDGGWARQRWEKEEGEREEDGDVGEEEEERRIRVCKEGKSCDALPHYLLARVQLHLSLTFCC